MKVIIYANWSEEEVITEKEYKEKLKKSKTNEHDFEEYVSDYLSDAIEHYLRERREPLCFASVFDLTEKERAEILNEMREDFKNQVEQDFSEEWEEVEIDI